MRGEARNGFERIDRRMATLESKMNSLTDREIAIDMNRLDRIDRDLGERVRSVEERLDALEDRAV